MKNRVNRYSSTQGQTGLEKYQRVGGCGRPGGTSFVFLYHVDSSPIHLRCFKKLLGAHPTALDVLFGFFIFPLKFVVEVYAHFTSRPEFEEGRELCVYIEVNKYRYWLATCMLCFLVYGHDLLPHHSRFSVLIFHFP